MDRIAEIWKLWDDIAQENNPDSLYFGNLGGGIHTVKSLKKISRASPPGSTPISRAARGYAHLGRAQQGRVAQSPS